MGFGGSPPEMSVVGRKLKRKVEKEREIYKKKRNVEFDHESSVSVRRIEA